MGVEPGSVREIADRSPYPGSVRLGNRPALATYEENGSMPFLPGSAARNVGVAARDAMNEAQCFEEREGTVDLGRGRPAAFPVESLQDVVGAYRLMSGEEQLEHRPSILGEAFLPLPADLLGPGEALRDACTMVMPRGRERRGSDLHSGLYDPQGGTDGVSNGCDNVSTSYFNGQPDATFTIHAGEGDTMTRLRNLVLTLGIALLATGPGMAASANAPAAVASIKPIHSLLAGVMEGVGRPTLLVPGGASPHTWSLRPSDARAIEDADFVTWIGGDLESFLVAPLDALAGDAYVLELSRAEGIVLLRAREGGTWDEHHDSELEEAHRDEDHTGGESGQGDEDHTGGESGQGDEDEHHGTEDEGGHAHHEDDHDHAHGEYNLHLWLEPGNAAVIVGAMADALSRLDPEHESTYRKNGAVLKERLLALDDELKNAFAPVRNRGFIVFHDAWQYLDTHYGLRAVGSVTVSPDRTPGAARIAAIREKISEAEATCVFAEPQFAPRLLENLVEGTGARTGTLDPLGAALEEGPGLYFDLMRANARAFRACFGL